MFSSRVLQRIQPCIGRSTRTTNIITNSIRYKSTKSNILKKASMALGKQSKKDAIKQANATNLRKREPVLKVTPAATAASMPEPPPVPVDVHHENFVPPPVSEEPQIPAQVPPPPVPEPTPVSAPVQPPVPAPSAFSRTEFHQGHLHEFAPRIVVVGVGGGGGNAVNNMIANELSGESFSFIILNDVILLIGCVFFQMKKVMNAHTTSSWTCLVVRSFFIFHFNSFEIFIFASLDAKRHMQT
jgi:hypothetical protein